MTAEQLPARHWNKTWCYRRLWVTDLSVLCFASIAAWFIARRTGLDLLIQDRLAGGLGSAARWPAGVKAPWTWLRLFGPWAAIAIGIATLILLIASLWEKKLIACRIHCVFLLSALLLGPGLVVNLLAKPYFGRPRPAQLARYGGWVEQYHPAFERVSPPVSRSFPSGHASTGYYFVAFYFIFRRAGRIKRWLGLLTGLILGSLIGYARMLAGGHYLSDVIWSCLFVNFVTFTLYYFLFNVPASEDQQRLNHAAALQSSPPGRLTLSRLAGSELSEF